MTERLREIIDNFHRYSTDHLSALCFGLSEGIVYDALVVAPSFLPYKILDETAWEIRQTGQQGYCAGWEAEKDGKTLAWIKTTSGGGNLLDYLLICGELRFRQMIFVGAAGALKPEFELGDVCTPSYSVAGTLANTYLKNSLRDYVPFEKIYPDGAYADEVIRLAASLGHTVKKASVFCTDSIAMEYTHLDEIRAFGTDLIEMETSAFAAAAKLMGVPSVALLAVSDNSATGVPLVGRTDEQQARYEHARRTVLGELIAALCASRKSEVGGLQNWKL